MDGLGSEVALGKGTTARWLDHYLQPWIPADKAAAQTGQRSFGGWRGPEVQQFQQGPTREDAGQDSGAHVTDQARTVCGQLVSSMSTAGVADPTCWKVWVIERGCVVDTRRPSAASDSGGYWQRAGWQEHMCA